MEVLVKVLTDKGLLSFEDPTLCHFEVPNLSRSQSVVETVGV